MFSADHINIEKNFKRTRLWSDATNIQLSDGIESTRHNNVLDEEIIEVGSARSMAKKQL